MFRLLALTFLLFTFQASALEVNGELENAVVENFSADPVTGLVEGRIYYNTVTKTSRIYDGTVWRNHVDANSTQTLTNKTIDGNNNTLTVLAPTQLSGFVPIGNGGTGQSTKAAAFDALSPNGSQGDLTYRGVSSNVALPVGANTQVLTLSGGYPSWQDASGGGGGSGEKTYITNPSALTVITGWVASSANMTVTRTTTASELPRENTTGTGIKIVSAAGAAADGDYVYFDYDLDDIDTNRKLNIKWAQSILATYSAGEFEVFIAAQSDRTVPIAIPSITAIPAANMDFSGNGFDTNATTAVSLVIMATGAVTVGDGIVISDVIVGPGQIVNVDPIGPWESYTPTGTFTTNTTYVGRKRRVGDTAEYQVSVQFSFDPNAATFSLNQPSGETIDTSAVPDISRGTLGIATLYDNSAGGAARLRGEVFYSNTTSVAIAIQGAASGTDHYQVRLTDAAPIDISTSDRLLIHYSVPIAEWAGAPNFAGSNDVEYASVGGTWDAASSTTVYGPRGVQMGGALTTQRAKTVTFLTPIQATDNIVIEMSADGIVWTPMIGSVTTSGRIVSSMYNNAGALVGAAWARNSATSIIVYFGQYSSIENDDGVAYNWGTDYWRVVKARAGSAVGFGAATQTSLGLVKAGQVPGTNTNDSAVAGNVGEYVENRRSSGMPNMTSNQFTSVDSGIVTLNDGNETGITLTPGEWEIQGTVFFTGAAGTTASELAVGIGTAKGNSSTGTVSAVNYTNFQLAFTAPARAVISTPVWTVKLSATTTYYLKAFSLFSVSTMSCSGNLWARRVR